MEFPTVSFSLCFGHRIYCFLEKSGNLLLFQFPYLINVFWINPITWSLDTRNLKLKTHVSFLSSFFCAHEYGVYCTRPWARKVIFLWLKSPNLRLTSKHRHCRITLANPSGMAAFIGDDRCTFKWPDIQKHQRDTDIAHHYETWHK